MSYRVYVISGQRQAVLSRGSTQIYGGRVDSSGCQRRKVLVKTGPAIVKELELDGNRVFNDGSRNDIEDKLEGVWIQIWHGDRKVGEFKSNNDSQEGQVV